MIGFARAVAGFFGMVLFVERSSQGKQAKAKVCEQAAVLPSIAQSEEVPPSLSGSHCSITSGSNRNAMKKS